MKKLLMVLLPLLILGGLIYWRFDQKKAEQNAQGGQRMGRMRGPASVELATPQVRDLVKSFQVTGSVESMQSVKISPKITGRIEYLEVREGDRVRTGQVLVRINQSEVEAAVRQEQAQVAEAKYRLAQAQLNQTPTDTAVATQIRQQEANLASAEAEYRQAEQTHAAQLEAVKASLDDAQSKIDNVSATVANANANIKSVQANLDNATTRYNRIYDLYKQGYIAAQDVDDAKTAVSVQQSALETARGQLQAATAAQSSAQAQKRAVEQQAAITRAKADADLEAARAHVKQAQASLEYARANAKQSPAFQQNIEALRASVAAAQASLDSAKAKFTDTVLASPLDGVVTARSQDPGALASPGQPILTVQSLNHVWVTVAVPEEICMKLHLNQPAAVRFEALGGREFQGRIAQINPAADLQSRQFTVRVVLDNAQHQFSPGMFAKVTLVTERLARALTIPLEALHEDRDGNKYIVVAGSDQQAHHRTVVTGLEDANGVAILSGLAPTEKVVTMSAMPLSDGQPIRASGGRGQRGGGGQGRGAAQGGATEQGADRNGGGDGSGRPGRGDAGQGDGRAEGRPGRGGDATAPGGAERASPGGGTPPGPGSQRGGRRPAAAGQTAAPDAASDTAAPAHRRHAPGQD